MGAGDVHHQAPAPLRDAKDRFLSTTDSRAGVRAPEPSGRQIATYFALLAFANAIGDPAGLLNLPVVFLLKDHLHLGPQAVATFEAMTALPVYAGFLFGFLRDKWRPFGWRDRGYLALAAPIAAGSYVWLATGDASYGRLFGALLIATLSYRVIDAVTEGLITEVAQRHSMTGRLSALSEVAEALPSAIAVLVGGWMATHASVKVTFLIAAAVTLMIFGQAFWRPTSVFAPAGTVESAEEGIWRSIRRVLAHPPIWPTMLILLLYNFSPGWNTPLLYYMTDRVKLSAQAFGIYQAISHVAIALATPIYSILCRKHPLARLLTWAMALNVMPGALFLLVRGAAQAWAVALVIGLLSGFGNIALVDLLRRSCPKDLEGTGVMLGFSVFALGAGGSDIFGAWLYEGHGLFTCLLIHAATTVLILPALLLVPKSLIATADGDVPV